MGHVYRINLKDFLFYLQVESMLSDHFQVTMTDEAKEHIPWVQECWHPGCFLSLPGQLLLCSAHWLLGAKWPSLQSVTPPLRR